MQKCNFPKSPPVVQWPPRRRFIKPSYATNQCVVVASLVMTLSTLSLSLSLSTWPPPSSSRPPERDGMFLFNHRRLLHLQNPFTRPLPKSHRNAAALPHLSRREALLQRPEASPAHLRDKPPGGGVSFVPSAVATPNSSVLSEEAFKRLDRFIKSL
ncbi:hypothetical protein Acr_09g0008060 [Actinidia rufa]|uniref:Uncharacterized protein n=1 Tax=Actinidia rufa TaxID=165716 RepID=A0A7J0F6Q6_9ERIC|nr:hypothetical protein Acr_09g0008060 [Actinidia rufa]